MWTAWWLSHYHTLDKMNKKVKLLATFFRMMMTIIWLRQLRSERMMWQLHHWKNLQLDTMLLFWTWQGLVEETLQTARGSHLNKHKPLQTTQLITTPLIQLSKVTMDITTKSSRMFQIIKLVKQQPHHQSARLVLPLCKSQVNWVKLPE